MKIKNFAYNYGIEILEGRYSKEVVQGKKIDIDEIKEISPALAENLSKLIDSINKLSELDDSVYKEVKKLESRERKVRDVIANAIADFMDKRKDKRIMVANTLFEFVKKIRTRGKVIPNQNIEKLNKFIKEIILEIESNIDITEDFLKKGIEELKDLTADMEKKLKSKEEVVKYEIDKITDSYYLSQKEMDLLLEIKLSSIASILKGIKEKIKQLFSKPLNLYDKIADEIKRLEGLFL